MRRRPKSPRVSGSRPGPLHAPRAHRPHRLPRHRQDHRRPSPRQRLGWAFVDCRRSPSRPPRGNRSPTSSPTEGEAGFRDREAAALAELCGRDRLILATGGGVDPPPRQPGLAAQRRVRRLAHGSTRDDLGASPGRSTTAPRRPNLTATGGVDEVRALIAAREPLYRETADFIAEPMARRRKRSPTLSSRHGLVVRTSRSSSGACAVFVLGPDGRVVPQRPDRPAAVREEHPLAVVALLRLLRPIRCTRQPADPRLPPAARQVPVLRRDVLQPLPVGRTRHRARRSSGCSSAEVLLNWHEHPGSQLQHPRRQQCPAAVAGTRPVPLPRRSAVGPSSPPRSSTPSTASSRR